MATFTKRILLTALVELLYGNRVYIVTDHIDEAARVTMDVAQALGYSVMYSNGTLTIGDLRNAITFRDASYKLSSGFGLKVFTI